jgi:class I fructose-bisphosphate aldolase
MSSGNGAAGVATQDRPAVRVCRPSLDELGLSLGKKVRLGRLLYGAGLRNGTLMVLPLDQGLEHGPRDFFDNPDSLDPEHEFRLAAEGNYNAIAVQIGLAQKHLGGYAGRVPLILKLNGKTEIPSDEHPISPLNATVEDAVRIGADAIGYTLYVGSSMQAEDFIQFGEVRREAEAMGMPIVVWAYPRGQYVEAKGGKESFWAIDYAARVAAELGADIVKLNYPKMDPEAATRSPKPYNTMGDMSADDAIKQIVKSAGRTLVLLSGGSRESDEKVLAKARSAMEAGAVGLIFGRNIWQRDLESAKKITRDLQGILAEFGSEG